MNELFELEYKVGDMLFPNGNFYNDIHWATVIAICEVKGLYRMQFTSRNRTSTVETIDYDVAERHLRRK